MKGRPFDFDPAIVSGLDEHGLLTILEPESFIDQSSAEQLVSRLTDIISSGALDSLDREPSSFGALSYSRLGYMADPGLADMVAEELLTAYPKTGTSRALLPVMTWEEACHDQPLRSDRRADDLAHP
jgi:hypothetical protein